MLTEKEKARIKTVLAFLSAEDVQSLASTLTKGNIVFSNREEYEQAILSFTESGTEFLHRRVCSKAILLEYAYREGLAVTSKISREDVIRLILNHWSQSYSENKVGIPGTTSIASHSELSQASAASNRVVNITNNYMINVNTHNTHIEHHTGTGPLDLERQFGEQFAHWFYDTLNHNDPISQGFCPSNFMPGTVLRTNHSIPVFNNVNVIHGCDNVANYFLQLFKNFKFQPNISGNGLKILSDPHGLRMVLVCGTVHTASVIELFEQSFGLVQDPHHQHNWKIQVSELRLREAMSMTKEMPQLQDFEDIPEIEANTIKCLQVALQN